MDNEISINDFIVIAKIGKGAYGKVFLCQRRADGSYFALKRVAKHKAENKNTILPDPSGAVKQFKFILHAKAERDIMTELTENPYMVELFHSFQDEGHLYFVMEFAPGGDLRSLMSNLNSFQEQDAKFYVAEMVLAVGWMHEKGYIHRDLKPDNFLIAKNGHLKLADFGLSRKGIKRSFARHRALHSTSFNDLRKAVKDERVSPKNVRLSSQTKSKSQRLLDARRMAYSVVGSPDYMAVELLSGDGYNFSVDWWSIGVMTFELLAGFTPFAGSTPTEVFANIENYATGLDDLQKACDEELPGTVSAVAWDFIRKCICAPENRFELYSQVLEHPFFDDLDLLKLDQITPPFVPHLTSDHDLQYFEHETISNPEEYTAEFIRGINDTQQRSLSRVVEVGRVASSSSDSSDDESSNSPNSPSTPLSVSANARLEPSKTDKHGLLDAFFLKGFSFNKTSCKLKRSSLSDVNMVLLESSVRSRRHSIGAHDLWK